MSLCICPWTSLKKFFFLTWTIFKVFIEFATTLLLFHVLVFWSWGMKDLSSLIRDWTHTPCIRWQSLNHWTTREVCGHAQYPLYLLPIVIFANFNSSFKTQLQFHPYWKYLVISQTHIDSLLSAAQIPSSYTYDSTNDIYITISSLVCVFFA